MNKRSLNLIFLCFLSIFLKGCLISNKAILPGYTSKEEFFDQDGFQDYTDYCKYYYEDEDLDLFSKSDLYLEVKEDDIENITSYFTNFEGWMISSDRLEKIILYKFNLILVL